MFEGLLNFLGQIYEWLIPWTVVQCYERGVLLRLGKFVKDLEPGFHWILPFGIDCAYVETTVPNSHHTRTQSLMTLDGKCVNAGCMVIYQIKNIRKFLLEVEGRQSFLTDCVYGAVSEHIMSSRFEDLLTEASTEKVFKAARKRGFTYGVEIQELRFVDLSLGKGLRLWQTNE